jgi:hypothetical protein
MPLSKFGKNNKDLAWQEKNMISLCSTCHIPWAHTKEARRRHINYLKELYGYVYDDAPWREYNE